MSGYVDTAGLRIAPEDGATLSIGASGLLAIVQLAAIKEDEIAALRRGALEVALAGNGATGFLLARFGFEAKGKAPLDFEMPFHVGILPPEMRRLPERTGGLVPRCRCRCRTRRARDTASDFSASTRRSARPLNGR